MSQATSFRAGDSWRRFEAIYERFEQAWCVDGAARIEDYLPPPDSPDRPHVLQELIKIDLEHRCSRGQPARIEDYVRRFPELQADGGLPSTLVREEIEGRRGDGESPGPAEWKDRLPKQFDTFVDRGSDVAASAASTPAEPGRLGRYLLRTAVGRGGFAAVYCAWDTELHREVALKVPREELLHDPEVRARVLREARSAARLRHPAIVPLHEVGQEGSLTWLVYELVNGPTLAQVLRETRPSHQQAALWIAALAEAIDYAHQSGIVHRDVKPANVIMRAGVEPVLTDFGLALQAEAGSTITQHGDILGTPAYMSPEQASGRGHQVDGRSDVYSLGVMLYEMLAGKVPFASPPPVILHQIIHEEPPTPRSLCPLVPIDLETICAKAMAKEPSRRYATAGDLAADLRRFLNHEPIRARRIGLIGRLLRWRRREPKVAALAAIATLTIVIGLIGVGGLWRHNERQASARFEAELQDLDRELSFFGNEEFVLVPQMDRARCEYLGRLGDKCQRLLRQHRDRAELRLKLAEVQLRLGAIEELLGNYREAETAYRDAEYAPGDGVAHRRLRTRSRLQLASLLTATGRFSEAEECLQRALNHEAGDGDEEYEHRAEALQKLGSLMVLSGRLDEGERELRLALQLLQLLVDRQPDNAGVQLRLAQIETQLANLEALFSRFEEAALWFNRALARQEQLIAAAPNVPVNRLAAARTTAARGHMLVRMGREKESGADLTRAYQLFKTLAEFHPHRPDYRFEAAAALHNLSRHDDIIAGEKSFDPNASMHPLEQRSLAAIAEQERLVAEFPAILDNHHRLALSLNSLATWLADMAMYAQTPIPKAVYIARSLHLHRRAHEIWSKIASDYPSVWAYQNSLTMSHQRFGIALERCGRLDEAEHGYRHAIGIQEELVRSHPKVARHFQTLSALHNNLGVVFDRRGDLAAAEQQFRRAVAYGAEALAINRVDPSARNSMSIGLHNVAEVLIRTGRHQEAAQLLNETARVWPEDWWSAFSVYEKFQQCVKAAMIDPSLTTIQRAELILKYENWTMDYLRKSVLEATQHTHDIPSRLMSESTLNHVRHRRDFQELLREATAKYAAKKKE